MVLFSNVVIQAQEINNSFSRLFSVDNSLGKLVKSFKIIGTLDKLNISFTLLLIDLQFPNIERFNFYPSDDNLYSCLTKMVTKKGRFKNLRSIPVPATMTAYKWYYMKCVNFLKDSVTTIDLFYSNMVDQFFYKSIVFLRENIDQFPNLKSIVIHTTTSYTYFDIYSQYLIDKIGIIIESNLESFQQLLITSFTNNGQHYLRLNFSRQDSLCITVYNGTSFLELNENIMVLIMNKLPNLKHISFKSLNKKDRNHVVTAPQPLLSEVALQFAYYLFKIPSFCAGDIPMSTQNAVKLIKYIYDNNYKHNSTPPLVSSTVVLATTKLYNHRYYSQDSLNQYPSSISFTENERKINLTTLFDKEDYNNSNNQMQLKFIQETGCFTSKMHLQVFRNTDLDVLLNCVADYSTRLVLLGISGLVNLSQQSNIKCEGRGNMIRTCSTVTMLTVYDCVPNSDNFVRILKHFPSLKTLLLKNCFTKNSWCGGERYVSIYLPYTSLDSLEIFIHENFVSYISERSVLYYIKLVTDDVGSKGRYYCFKANYRDKNTIRNSSVLTNVTESDFEESIIDPVKSSCIIYCKSLHALYIHYVAEEDSQAKTIRLF